MKTKKIALSLAGLSLLTIVFGKAALADNAPDNVAGNWTIYSTNIENGAVVLKHVQIAQYGDRITGFFEGPYQSGPIQGKVRAHHVEFNTVTRTVIHFRGQIYGNNMSGLYGIKGRHAPWQAVRPVTAVQVTTQPMTTVAYSTPQPAPQYNQAPAPQYNQAPAPQYNQAPQNNQTAPQYNEAPAQQSSQEPESNGSSAVPAPLSEAQLDSLVAPIALYPDSLVAQVLAAAAIPDEVSEASEWLQQNSSLTGYALAQAVDQQTWDPSIKAMTQFPSVLENMAKNLGWTSSLGQAFHFQQSDVMAAVQAMRAKAKAAGTLQTSSQIVVTQPAASTIVIQPANPQVVYVPQYNPAIVYGAPVVVPLYTPPVVFATPALTFGVGVSIGGFFGGGGVVAGGFVGGGFGWGFHAWNINWGGCCGGGGGGTTIIYNHNTYINNRTWNNHYNGYHPWNHGGATPSPNRGYYGPNGGYHPDPGYRPGTDTHYGPNGGYHPNGYFGPNGAFHHDVPGTGTANHPNGGDNGNHGLIGGNGGVQHPAAEPNANNGTRPNGAYTPQRENGNAQPRGLDTARNNGGSQAEQGRFNNQNRMSGGERDRSRFSGNGWNNRAESRRGHESMGGGHREHMGGGGHEHAEHFGGGRRR